MAQQPERIDKYEIVRRLGRGGMGTVYLARDPDLDRPIAIKVLRDPLLEDELLQRFFREARAAANLRHENIITVYDVGQYEHQPFMAMEYVDGTTLGDMIRTRHPMTLSEKLAYLEQICAGLHFAHTRGIVHRDVKPANLMVDRHNLIRILDFGIARVAGSGMTRDGAMIGTLSYMSPEQMLGKPVDHRSDIFAVGAVAYELLAYRQAFPGSLEDGLLHRLPNEDPPPLTEFCPGLPPGLEQIVLRALAKKPENRFAGLDETRTAVREIRRALDPEIEFETMVTPGRGKARPAKPASTAGASTERRDILERRERQIAVNRDAARAALARQDLDAAIAACEDALTLDPEDAEAHALLDQAQQAKQRRADESRARHERERLLRERLVDAELKFGKGDISGAAAVLQEALTLNPHDPGVQALLPRVREAAAAAAVTVALPSEAELTILVNRAAPAAASAARVTPPSATMPQAVVATTPDATAPASRRPVLFAAAGLAVVAVVVVVVLSMGGGPQSAPATPPRDSAAAAPSSALASNPAPAPAAVPPVSATPPPTTTAASPGAPPVAAARGSVSDNQLTGITRAFDDGDLAGALRLIEPVLQESDDPRARGLAQRIAQRSLESMAAAERDARNRKAADLARGPFDTATQAKTAAERAFKTTDFARAGRQALAATDSFRRAERDALAAAAAAVTTAQPAAPTPATPSPTPSNTASVSPNPPPAATPPVASAAASTPAPTPPPPPAAATTPPPAPTIVSALERERGGIMQALEQYRNAYHSLDIEALVKVYPTLPREMRQSLERAFKRDCRDYDVTFGNMIPLLGDDPTIATVSVRGTYTCTPKSRQAPTTQSVQEVFQLRKFGNAWVIEKLGTMGR